MFRSTAGTGAGAARYAADDAKAGHRMDETLVVLDLSMADDASILDDARKLYRARPKQTARRDVVDAAVAADALQPRRQLPDVTAL